MGGGMLQSLKRAIVIGVLITLEHTQLGSRSYLGKRAWGIILLSQRKGGILHLLRWSLHDLYYENDRALSD